MKIENINPRELKNELIRGFFEEDISSVIFKNTTTNKWKAYTIFGLQKTDYRVRVTDGKKDKIHMGYSANISERTLETLIQMVIKSEDYNRVILKASKVENGKVVDTTTSTVVARTRISTICMPCVPAVAK